MQKVQDGREIEFVITVRENIVEKDKSMQFYTQADNKRTRPVHRFPYEGDDLT